MEPNNEEKKESHKKGGAKTWRLPYSTFFGCVMYGSATQIRWSFGDLG